jgi:hypothetical protein
VGPTLEDEHVPQHLLTYLLGVNAGRVRECHTTLCEGIDRIGVGTGVQCLYPFERFGRVELFLRQIERQDDFCASDRSERFFGVGCNPKRGSPVVRPLRRESPLLVSRWVEDENIRALFDRSD